MIQSKRFWIICISTLFGNISKYFSVANMKETRLNGYVYVFSIDYFDISVINNLDIYKYLMKKNNIR